MSKQTKGNGTPQSSDPTSIQDAGYKFAIQGDTASSIAQFVLAQCPNFLDDVPSEVKDQLYAGFQLRKHELTGEKSYKLSEGVLIPCDDRTVPGLIVMSINVAMSYSQQEFGKLKDRDPGLHAVVKPMRDAFSSYASNNMKALTAKIKAIVNAGKPRTRTANKGFREAMKDAFDTYEKRVKTAKDRGDADANPVKFLIARDAFWTAYDRE
jgi:hypothetical protein